MFFDLCKRDEKKIFIFSISAVIGVGKSTLVNRLKQTNALEQHFDQNNVDIIYVQEPVALWEQKGWLQTYYGDQNKYALTFQLAVMDSHVKAVAQALKDYRDNNKIKICIVERCTWDQLLFWKMQVDSGYTSADKFGDEVYMNNWENLSSLVPDVSLIFFAKTSLFETTQERLRQREPGKDALYAYNERLYQKHLDWYSRSSSGGGAAGNLPPVVELNMDSNFNTEQKALDEIVSKMVISIKNLVCIA